MKKCPKCGAISRTDSAACYNCFASLDDVPETAETAGEAEQPAGPPQPPAAEQPPVSPAGAQPEPPPGQGGPQPGPVQGLPPGAHIPPQGPYGRSTGQERYPLRGAFRRPAVVQRSNVGAIVWVIVLLVVLAGGGFAAWKYIWLPRGPIKAVREFMKASSADDVQELRKSLSQNSQWFVDMAERMSNMYGGRAGSMNLMGTGNELFEEGKQYVLKVDSIQGTTAKVYMKPGPTSSKVFSDMPGAMKDGLPITVVKEGKEWKVDLMTTVTALAGEAMKQYGGKLPVAPPGSTPGRFGPAAPAAPKPE